MLHLRALGNIILLCEMGHASNKWKFYDQSCKLQEHRVGLNYNNTTVLYYNNKQNLHVRHWFVKIVFKKTFVWSNISRNLLKPNTRSLRLAFLRINHRSEIHSTKNDDHVGHIWSIQWELMKKIIINEKWRNRKISSDRWEFLNELQKVFRI